MNIKKILFSGLFSLAVLGGLRAQTTAWDQFEQEFYSSREEDTRLSANTGPLTMYYVHIEKKEFLKQLDSLAKHADKEEAFIYVPKIQTAFEYGINETDSSAYTSEYVFTYLAAAYDTLEEYHFHPYLDDPSVIQKAPSGNDRYNYLLDYVDGMVLNPRFTLSAHHTSAYGLTSYVLYDRSRLFQAVNYARRDLDSLKRANTYNLHIDINDFLEQNCFIRKVDEKALDSLLKVEENYSVALKKSRGELINFFATGGKQNDYFYIEFIPTNKEGELLGNQYGNFKRKD
ncbi:MAG: hypothetical protein KC535_02565 [Nanoarchaeota archaeon]|nr:hypothetical protein [Nanoarchaeota archaeon]